MNTWPLQRDCAKFYGDPDVNGDGVADRAWEDANIVSLAPRWNMWLAWDPTRQVKRIRIHKACAESLGRILDAIALHYLSQEKIEQHRLHLYGGAYNFRTMRGSNKLSMHAYGCAIDFDPENNPLGKSWRAGMIPQQAVLIFEQHGWVWGGHWSRPDAQHFQAARVA